MDEAADEVVEKCVVGRKCERIETAGMLVQSLCVWFTEEFEDGGRAKGIGFKYGRRIRAANGTVRGRSRVRGPWEADNHLQLPNLPNKNERASALSTFVLEAEIGAVVHAMIDGHLVFLILELWSLVQKLQRVNALSRRPFLDLPLRYD